MRDLLKYHRHLRGMLMPSISAIAPLIGSIKFVQRAEMLGK
jgi:hypothetical protein